MHFKTYGCFGCRLHLYALDKFYLFFVLERSRNRFIISCGFRAFYLQKKNLVSKAILENCFPLRKPALWYSHHTPVERKVTFLLYRKIILKIKEIFVIKQQSNITKIYKWIVAFRSRPTRLRNLLSIKISFFSVKMLQFFYRL